MDIQDKIIMDNIEISKADLLRPPTTPKEKLIHRSFTIADQQRLIIFILSNPVLMKEHIDKSINLLNELRELLPSE